MAVNRREDVFPYLIATVSRGRPSLNSLNIDELVERGTADQFRRLNPGLAAALSSSSSSSASTWSTRREPVLARQLRQSYTTDAANASTSTNRHVGGASSRTTTWPLGPSPLEQEAEALEGQRWQQQHDMLSATTAMADSANAQPLPTPPPSTLPGALTKQEMELYTKSVEEQFREQFCFDTLESTKVFGILEPLLADYIKANSSKPSYLGDIESLRRRLSTPADNQHRVPASPLMQSAILKELRQQDAQSGRGYFNLQTAEALPLMDELADCPLVNRSYLEQFLRSPMPDVHPLCKNGSQCLCRSMAERCGPIELDERLPNNALNGAVPFAQKRTGDPGMQRAKQIRDEIALCNSPTQGFIGPRYMNPAQYKAFLSGTWTPDPGPCLVCHLAEVTTYHQQMCNSALSRYINNSGHGRSGGGKNVVNMFHVEIDKPGEFRSEACLPIQTSSGHFLGIYGAFPRFNRADFAYETYLTADKMFKRPCLKWIGVDFRPSSAE
jgi:hypothetical protein